ncbi:MAG: DODA-type extradiol aromatic ring-opening family dioxygenase, partial [Rhodoferax sp.]
MTTPAPVLFISHGAPTMAIEPGLIGQQLRALGARLPAIRAVLVVSPHWQTREVVVMATAQPQTLYDFGGFPASLYALTYPAPGAPALAALSARTLSAAGYQVQLDDRRGLDHGAWVPLFHLLPEAQVPVFQVSMPYTLTTAEALQLGRALAPLREQGVLIMGSGSMTHNLGEFRGPATQASPYVQEFESWVDQAVLGNQVDALVNYRQLAPHAQRAHPSEEHLLPLLESLGAQRPGHHPQLIDGG